MKISVCLDGDKVRLADTDFLVLSDGSARYENKRFFDKNCATKVCNNSGVVSANVKNNEVSVLAEVTLEELLRLTKRAKKKKNKKPTTVVLKLNSELSFLVRL